MKALLRYVKLGVIVAISAIYASPAFADTQLPQELSKMDTAPDRTSLPEKAVFIEKDGSESDLKDLKGQVILVNLWATWCAPCIEEMPDLDRLASEMDGKPFRILALSQDRGGAEIVQEFFDENGIGNLDVVLDPRGATARAFGARGLPTSFVIDANGQVIGKLEGTAKWDADGVIAYFNSLIDAAS
ncbi:TlpA disulfide reductase family protein [Thalassospira australica]|uniref:TlpA disulfide reductase family protein n=1 Tax=Thalassospira australica TaxID=1528106 RepID=UPI00384D2E07